jgi:hypothetical protein
MMDLYRALHSQLGFPITVVKEPRSIGLFPKRLYFRGTNIGVADQLPLRGIDASQHHGSRAGLTPVEAYQCRGVVRMAGADHTMSEIDPYLLDHRIQVSSLAGSHDIHGFLE